MILVIKPLATPFYAWASQQRQHTTLPPQPSQPLPMIVLSTASTHTAPLPEHGISRILVEWAGCSGEWRAHRKLLRTLKQLRTHIRRSPCIKSASWQHGRLCATAHPQQVYRYGYGSNRVLSKTETMHAFHFGTEGSCLNGKTICCWTPVRGFGPLFLYTCGVQVRNIPWGSK